MFGRVSPDGRFITYVDWVETGNLMVHDVVADSDRALTSNVSSSAWPGEAGFSTVSRDGKQVAYTWNDHQKDRQDLLIAALQGTGIPTPRQVFEGGDDVRFLSPHDWSPDGKWIAVTINRKDGTGQIALIAVADGTLQVLKSVGWNVPEHIFFSPDGKYVAYELPANDTNDQRDIFVLATDGSREIPAVVNPAQESLLGWSPTASCFFSAAIAPGP
jgi:Tol biopolymer transport system component